MTSSKELQAVLKRWPWLLVFAILTAGAAYGASTLQDKMYESQALIRIVQGEQNPTGGTAESLEVLTDTYVELAASDRTFALAEERLGGRASADEVKSASSVDVKEVAVLRLVSEARRPERAADLATGYAQGFTELVERDGEAQRRAAVNRIGARLRRLRAQLAEEQQGGGEATALVNEIQQLAFRSADLSARPPDEARIIENPSVPGNPASPKPARNAAVAFLFALLLGAGVVFVRAAVSGRYESSEALSTDLGVPVLGELPRADGDDPAARDAFRALRTNLEFAVERGPNTRDGPRRRRTSARNGGGHVVLVTSPGPQAGKTYVAIGLARSLAADGQRAIAVDGDLRRPTLHTRLDLSSEPGLLDLVEDPDRKAPVRTLDKEVIPGSSDGTLEAVTAGRATERSAEMLATEAVENLLKELSGSGGIVVVDSPPLLGVTDAAVLARYADAVVIVVDYRGSNRRETRRAKQALEAVQAPLIGVVFNRLPPTESSYYRYGYHTDKS